MFDTQDLDDFISALSKDAVRYDTKPAGLDTVIDARRKAGCRHNEMVQLILAGKLSKLGVLSNVPGYPGFLVDSDEIARLVRGEDLAGIVVTRISTDLGVPHAAMAQMLDVHLPTSLGMHPKRRCPQRIVESSVYQNFKNRYVSLRDLAREAGLNPKTQLADLRRRGIKPEPGFPKGTFLFLRSSL